MDWKGYEIEHFKEPKSKFILGEARFGNQKTSYQQAFEDNANKKGDFV